MRITNKEALDTFTVKHTDTLEPIRFSEKIRG